MSAESHPNPVIARCPAIACCMEARDEAMRRARAAGGADSYGLHKAGTEACRTALPPLDSREPCIFSAELPNRGIALQWLAWRLRAELGLPAVKEEHARAAQ